MINHFGLATVTDPLFPEFFNWTVYELPLLFLVSELSAFSFSYIDQPLMSIR